MKRLVLLTVLLCTQHAASSHAETPKPKPVVIIKKPIVKRETPRQIAQRVSRSKGVDLRQWRCLDMLWTKESHFNPKAHNKKTGAYGIAQFLPKTWGSRKRTSNVKTQVEYGLKYIDKRYGSPCAAWNHHRKHGWY